MDITVRFVELKSCWNKENKFRYCIWSKKWNGNLCDLKSRIIDNLENGANVLVLLKEEYESEMRERKKREEKVILI